MASQRGVMRASLVDNAIGPDRRKGVRLVNLPDQGRRQRWASRERTRTAGQPHHARLGEAPAR
eukprot:7344090-Pyramimonas_sp.AAC.2